MAFEKGNKLAGSRKGVANKATSAVREAIATFASDNVERLQGWLDKIAETEPKEAAKLYLSAIEYHIPKLARKDVQMLDENGEPANAPSFTVTTNYVKPK